MRRGWTEEDENSSEDEGRNPRSRRPRDDPKRRKSRWDDDGGREPDKDGRGEPDGGGEPRPKRRKSRWDEVGGHEPDKDGSGEPDGGGEPLRAGDGVPPMPRAAEIQEELEEGEIPPEDMERSEAEVQDQLQAPEPRQQINSTRDEPIVPMDYTDGEDGGGERDGGGGGGHEPLRASDGAPPRPTAADRGKGKVYDGYEEEVVRARPLKISSSGPGTSDVRAGPPERGQQDGTSSNSNREVSVNDQQLEELKSYLRPRIGNHRETRSDKEDFLTELAGDLSIFLLGSSKTAILPAKPKIDAQMLRKLKCHQDVVTNFYYIHRLPAGEAIELYQVIWPRRMRDSSNPRNKMLMCWKTLFERLGWWNDHFGIRMYDGGPYMVLNLHPRGHPNWLSTTRPNTFPITKIDDNEPEDQEILTIEYKGSINFDEFKRFRDKSENALFPQINVDVANIIMKQYCREREYIESGRFYFEKNGGVDIERILIKKLGYFQSVRLLAVGLALNVDVIGTAFYKPDQNLVDVWNGLVTGSPPILPDLKAGLFNGRGLRQGATLSPAQVDIVNDYWKNLKIELNISSHCQRRRYTIEKVTRTSAVDQRIMEISTNRPTHLIDFMNRTYGWRDNHEWNKLPAIKLLRAKKDKSGKIPVELFVPWGCCSTSQESRVTGVMPGLLRLLHTKVDERYQNISQWISERYEDRSSRYLAAEAHFNVLPETSMLAVMPLALTQPRIEVGRSNNESRNSTGRPAQRGTSSSVYDREQSFTNPATIKHWSIISFDEDNRRTDEDVFVENLLTEAKKKGMIWDRNTSFPRVPPGSFPDIIRYNPREFPRERLLGDLKSLTDDAERANGPLELILCFMRKKMAMEYSVIKFFLDRQAGVPSQVIMSRPNKSRQKNWREMNFDNLLLKINVKCGGTNFRIAREMMRNSALLQDTILMGLDVTHPKHGGKDTKFSIVALVATTDQNGVDYACRLKAQPSGQELTDSESMKTMVTELLNVYKENAGKYPARIVLFRDGLGESQIFSNLRFEGTAILRAARALRHDGNAPYEPKLAMILSIKGHHTRFFAVRPDDRRDPSGTAPKRQRTGASTSQARGNPNHQATQYIAENIQAGTVVYDTVTHPLEFDFYLCSQASGLGTSRPTKYHVVLDQISVEQHELYQTIYTLCYTFQRSPKGVSLVTPVSYAHLAAARANIYLEEELLNAVGGRMLNYKTLDMDAHFRLKDRLWFL